MGKKLAISLLTLNLISTKKLDPDISIKLLTQVAIGVICAIIGTLLPYPHLASTELATQALLTSESLSALLNDIVKDWQYSTIPKPISHEERPSSVIIEKNYTHKSTQGYKLKGWKRYFAVMRAIAAFKLAAKGYFKLSWTSKCSKKADSSNRQEMLVFLQAILDKMRLWINDASFGPRASSMDDYTLFLNLISCFIIACSRLDERIDALDFEERENKVFFPFNSRPEFRRTMRSLSEATGKTLISFAKLLNSVGASKKSALDSTRSQVESLQRAQVEFNDEYDLARKQIYYGCYGQQCSESWQPTIPLVFLEMNSFLFLIDSICHHLNTFWQSKSGNTYVSPSSNTLLSMLRNVFPEQGHLFPRFTGFENIPVAVKRRLKQSFTVGIAILLTGIYGLYSKFTTQTSLAAFTIAYITGAVVFGANMLTSLTRAIGTVFASVYTIITLRVVSSWSATNSTIARGVCTVFFQLPATYIRTYPLYGYAGTVAGFTVAILLLVEHPDSGTAIQRTVDTYIGVIIYVALEALFGALSSEQEIFNIMKKVVGNIDKNFSIFHSSFRAQDDESDISVSQLIDFIHNVTAEQELMRFVSKEPTIFRAKPIRRELVNELLLLEIKAYRIMSMMFWALDLSRAKKFTHLLPQLQEELDAVRVYISYICSNMVDIIEKIQKIRLKSFILSIKPQVETFEKGLLKKSSLKHSSMQSEAYEIVDLNEYQDVPVLEQLLRKHKILTEHLQDEYWVSSNKELTSAAEAKVVNSVICSVRDFMGVMSKMTKVLERMLVFRQVSSSLRDPT